MEVSSSVSTADAASLFPELFLDKDIPSLESSAPLDKIIESESNVFKKGRGPVGFARPEEHWKNRIDLPHLRRAAKIIFSIAMSSAAIERLFSEAGLLLSKMRKNLSPATIMALVYRKYCEKYQQLLQGCSSDVSKYNGAGIFWLGQDEDPA